jgi:hypothetical protein
VYDFRFLQPTGGNLAALHVVIRHAPIPASFRPLPRGDFVIAGAGL